MAATRSLKPKETYETFINNLAHFVIPSKDDEPIFLGIINDIFREKNLEEGTKNERGLSGSRVHVTAVLQHMVQGMRWEEFLHKSENKDDLITLAGNYSQSKD